MRFSLRGGLAALGAVGAAAAVAAVLLASGSHASSPRSSAQAARPASLHLSAAFLARARAAAIAGLRNMHPNIPAGRSVHVAGTNLTKADSFNWSGYADTSSTAQFFSSVSGSWTVPAVTCSSEDRLLSTWVGLDGFGTGTVEQDGTTEQCFEHVALYYTWYEMYPAGSVTVATGVQAGDAISASVVRSGTGYTLKVTDSTTSGNNVNQTATCALTTCLDESAEWIAERPSYSTGITPLTQFKTPYSATASAVTGGGTSGNPHTIGSEQEISMIDSTQSYFLATPTSLTNSNTAFTVHWHNSF
jgi:Peptidase A4 family